MDWPSARVLITGGASFIGSHLADALVARGVRVRVVDDLSSGNLANIRGHIDSGDVEFLEGDLLDQDIAPRAVAEMDAAFHADRELVGASLAGRLTER